MEDQEDQYAICPKCAEDRIDRQGGDKVMLRTWTMVQVATRLIKIQDDYGTRLAIIADPEVSYNDAVGSAVGCDEPDDDTLVAAECPACGWEGHINEITTFEDAAEVEW